MTLRFHYDDGWFFSRSNADTIVVEHESPDGICDVHFEITMDGWASIVASLSPYGDTKDAWEFIKQFNEGSLDF